MCTLKKKSVSNYGFLKFVFMNVLNHSGSHYISISLELWKSYGGGENNSWHVDIDGFGRLKKWLPFIYMSYMSVLP